jgi:hypothetical protein
MEMPSTQELQQDDADKPVELNVEQLDQVGGGIVDGNGGLANRGFNNDPHGIF